MEIKRTTYLNQLYLRENNGFIKVITGVRRCGKSYLLFKLFKKELLTRGITDDHIISIALDNIENRGLREPVALYEHIKKQLKDNELYYVLLDEIQFVPDFSEVLNSLLQLEHTDIYVTGSNSKFLSSDILTEFRGRGDEVRVYPLSFAEYMSVYNGTEEDAFNEYMTFGGLPRILSFQTDEQKVRYLTDLFKETYLKDIIEHNKIHNTNELEYLVNILASAVGSLTNPTKLENTFRTVLQSSITDKTIKKYMDYLLDAFLIDTAMMENIIYTELKRRGYSVDVGLIEIRENDSSGNRIRKQLEVDFIACQGNNKYYIQSFFSSRRVQKGAGRTSSVMHRRFL